MKKNLIIAFLALSSIFFIFKQDYILSQIDDDGEKLSAYIGTNLVLPVSNVTSIAIGNPVIADVVQVTKKSVTIAPKSLGSTTLMLHDNFGEQSYIVNVFSDDTKALKARIDNSLSTLNIRGVYTNAKDEEGKVFLLGKFDNAGLKNRAILAFGPLAAKIVDLTAIKEDETVVEIDVQVLELNKGSTATLGFSWPGSINLTEVAGRVPNLADPGVDSFGKLFQLGNMFRSSYSLKLDMLIQEGKARVLSRPRLSCLSGKEAKLLVGGEVPVLSATVTGGGTSGTSATPGNVEYKEYGIKLNIKPTVKENGRIYLNLEVEVSEVGETAVSTSYALAYPFTKRTAKTELYLDNGQTMAIGGLIKRKTEEQLRKLPWLADVPVLGLFFRQRLTKEGKGQGALDDSELFITLTPRIVVQGAIKERKDNLAAGKPLMALPEIDESTLDPVTRYSKVIQRRIVENLTYPHAAKSSGFQGLVKLALKLSYKGDLLETKLVKSSGYKVLDENALLTVKDVTPYPPFPPTIKAQDLWVEVPVAYQLE